MAKAKISETRSHNLVVTIEPDELRKIADAIERHPGHKVDQGFIPLITKDMEMVVSIRFVAPMKKSQRANSKEAKGRDSKKD